MSNTKTAAIILAIAAVLHAGAGYAHPELRSAEPAAGLATTMSPTQIRITFNENVILQFSGIELKDQAGKIMPTGKPTIDPANKKSLIVPVNEQLPPGDYKVEWHAVSDDTHRVKGNYAFTIRQ
ncbi:MULTISPECIES: copper homeostasis periplasmic binding protein CopC [unclassified Bradyrhizobium]|uniref:copper homeostasis periplasmic binding protein CopC n=1 Tax=unclassified Bradyrhizobium TaxID=2631580 RepID=UPI001FFB7FAF|nr:MULTISPECIES: copper homeostasis periplasmic binding protein CopC [unclassified Bradyrhizobium]MCK1709116.1 copper homeostasis periplasmic binding protein CopC [Bradyrhizobium sp. 143]MCK1726410.1 copper homeostasis periplasmic binding protein CopC [Bradyrhizobium sp. 142]